MPECTLTALKMSILLFYLRGFNLQMHQHFEMKFDISASLASWWNSSSATAFLQLPFMGYFYLDWDKIMPISLCAVMSLLHWGSTLSKGCSTAAGRVHKYVSTADWSLSTCSHNQKGHSAMWAQNRILLFYWPLKRMHNWILQLNLINDHLCSL